MELKVALRNKEIIGEMQDGSLLRLRMWKVAFYGPLQTAVITYLFCLKCMLDSNHYYCVHEGEGVIKCLVSFRR